MYGQIIKYTSGKKIESVVPIGFVVKITNLTTHEIAKHKQTMKSTRDNYKINQMDKAWLMYFTIILIV